MLDSKLKYWIAESESWQSFIDFNLPADVRADYSFTKTPDDFYISLMSEALDLFKQEDCLESENVLLSIAKGLEVYSLEKKRVYFDGINPSDNLLYVSGLYYLAGYAASAFILSKLSFQNSYDHDIDLFLSSFLRRVYLKNNIYSMALRAYMDSGDNNYLKILLNSIQENKERAFNEQSVLYASFKLAEVIIQKFGDDNLWSDLLKQNTQEHWIDYVSQNLSKKVPIWSFFPSQKEAISKGILQEGNTCSLQMPTSAGKTAITELIIYDEFKKNPNCKILYLAPYRSLASELKLSIARTLSDLGVLSKTVYGGNYPTSEEKAAITDINLLISTPEKFMAIEDVLPGAFNDFTTIICDEGHLLDDHTRGLSYELLLSRLKAVRDVNRRFIFISAIIPNVSTINQWLGGNDDSLVTSDYRPTQLEYAFLKEMPGREKAFYIDVNPTRQKPENYQLYKYLSSDELKIVNSDSGIRSTISSKKGITVAVALKALNSGPVALFAPHKRGPFGVEDLSEEAVNQVRHIEKVTNPREYSNEDQMHALKEFFLEIFGEAYLLTQIIDYGILFHHGDLPQSVREIIEDTLKQGHIKMVICTNTLAEGVNLPIKTMVIHATKRYNAATNRMRPLKVRDLKNLVGRAGRAGKETKGMVLVPHARDFATIEKVIKDEEVEEVKGRLYFIVSLITDYLKKQRIQLSNEILDDQEEDFMQLLDSIETSIVDLLAEEIEVADLKDVVENLIQDTLSYHQSNNEEKETLRNLVSLRSEKIVPFIERGDFSQLKRSGSHLRLYNDIKGILDFDNPVWNDEIETFEQAWVSYIFNEGIFSLPSCTYELDQFNSYNKTDLGITELWQGIELWLKGSWYHEIAKELGIETFQVLKLINSIIGFYLTTTLSTMIRIKELISEQYTTPKSIANWPLYLQHGLHSKLHIDLVQMGLIERLSVINLSQFLIELDYQHNDYIGLKSYLIANKDNILEGIRGKVPIISFNKIKSMLRLLRYRNIH